MSLDIICLQREKSLSNNFHSGFSFIVSLLLGIAEQNQALSAAVDANTEEKRLLSRLVVKTKKAQADASDLQRYQLINSDCHIMHQLLHNPLIPPIIM